MRLKELGENEFIRRIRERFQDRSIRLGIGDDAAIIDVPSGNSIVYCSDLVAENVHFIRDLHPADSIAFKAVAVNVSDVGAMGGVPRFFTLSVALPGDLEATWLEKFVDGLAQACKEFGVSLAGGDSSSSERIFVDVSMVGWIETGHEIRRSGAKPGDNIYVTGSLGSSALGLEHLRNGDLNHPSTTKHLYPTPRHRVGRLVGSQAHAMIDISDGLSTDLGHLVQESTVSALIHRNLIPSAPGATADQVLHGGEEYELLIVAPSIASEIDGIPVTHIGEVIPAGVKPEVLMTEDGVETVLEPKGYEHFRSQF